MLTHLVRRLQAGIVTLLLITVVVFTLVNAAPGGPAAIMNMTTTASERAALTRAYGLDKPLPLRYLSWLADAVRHASLAPCLRHARCSRRWPPGAPGAAHHCAFAGIVA